MQNIPFLLRIASVAILFVGFGFAKPSGKIYQNSSPKGRIIYTKQVDSTEYTASGGSYELFLSSSNGTITRLTHYGQGTHKQLGGAIRTPVFSPEGKHVLFRSNYNIPENAEQMTRLTDAEPHKDAFLNVWLLDLEKTRYAP